MLQSLLMQGSLAGCLAAAINIVIYFIAKSTGAINDSVLLPPGKPLRLFPIILSSFLPAMLASLLLYVLVKTVANPINVFAITGSILLLLSLGGPIAVKGLPVRARIALALMHIFAGVIIIFVLSKTGGATAL